MLANSKNDELNQEIFNVYVSKYAFHFRESLKS